MRIKDKFLYDLNFYDELYNAIYDAYKNYVTIGIYFDPNSKIFKSDYPKRDSSYDIIINHNDLEQKDFDSEMEMADQAVEVYERIASDNIIIDKVKRSLHGIIFKDHTEMKLSETIYCAECDETIDFIINKKFNFCPYCGISLK